jgi:3-deoxy-manno-octulosonate cytidylyltransferase (CMP-KDO synthetase)
VAVIPARYASSRFPGKPLAMLEGKPMIQHVWERCVASAAFSEVLVATDDGRIAEAVKGFGGNAVMTSPQCASGTDRVAEVAIARPAISAFVNVQGDEPLIQPEALRTLSAALDGPDVHMATLVRPLEEGERSNPNVVKVVLTRRFNALYFSRADIPYQREGGSPPPRYAHIGLYAYRRDTLLELARLRPSPLEEAEKLEQLRALENGFRIRCVVTSYRSLGVDTPDDLARAQAALSTPSG